MYSYFHSLGNWNLVWLFGSTGVGESVADILHFVPLMGANIKHQDGTGTALKNDREENMIGLPFNLKNITQDFHS